MKIGIFDPYLSTLGGGENYILSGASFLSKKNDVSLFWDKENLLLQAQRRFDLDLSKLKISKNIFSSDISFFKKISLSKNYDLIFYLSDGSLPILISKKLFVHFQFPVNWVNGKSILNQFKIKRISKIICNSYFTKKYIDKNFEIKSDVLYPPVNVNVENIKGFKKEKIILTVGRFQYVKNGSTYKKHEVLIDIFKNLIKANLATHYKLIIIATFLKEEDYFSLKEKTSNLPIEIYRDLNAKDLAVFYKKAEIYWHASGFGEDIDKNPHLAEHFGMTTVEAMSYGAVPIVINLGGQIEIIENSKSGFLWNSKKECESISLRLIKDKNLREKISLFAFERSKLFSREIFNQNLEKLIEEN